MERRLFGYEDMLPSLFKYVPCFDMHDQLSMNCQTEFPAHHWLHLMIDCQAVGALRNSEVGASCLWSTAYVLLDILFAHPWVRPFADSAWYGESRSFVF